MIDHWPISMACLWFEATENQIAFIMSTYCYFQIFWHFPSRCVSMSVLLSSRNLSLIRVTMKLVQNTSSRDGQIKQLVYSMENAILNLPQGQEEMMWFIDFKNWNMSKAISVKTTQETAHILQNHYPERLGIAILYNPPLIFETFWQVRNWSISSNSCAW